jgi:hypothetical protein
MDDHFGEGSRFRFQTEIVLIRRKILGHGQYLSIHIGEIGVEPFGRERCRRDYADAVVRDKLPRYIDFLSWAESDRGI